MPTPIVFFDIAGPDASALQTFYSDVFDWTFDAMSQATPPIVMPLSGAIREDPAEKRIYLGVPDITATLVQVEAAGGTIEQPRFEVPGVVVLALFRDLAGNEMGLVEMDGDNPRIP